jgi:hypothetical protein
MKGHKRSICRKPTKYKGNYRGEHHSGNNYSGQRFHKSQHDGKKLQPRWRNGNGSAHYTEKTSSEGSGTNLYTFGIIKGYFIYIYIKLWEPSMGTSHKLQTPIAR